MKNLLTILVLSVYLLSATELGQLLKVPVLISHFIEHKKNDADITFWWYLVHHYGGHEKDADWETDMKLPFMQHTDILVNLVFLPINPVSIPKKIHISSNTRRFVFYRDGCIPESCLGSIWQPPRSC